MIWSRQALSHGVASLVCLLLGCAPPAEEAERGEMGAESLKEATQPAGLPPGTFRASVTDGRFRLVSDGGGLFEILERLGEMEGFDVFVGDVSDATVDANLEEVSLTDALATLLAGIPYQLEYRPHPTTGAQRLHRLILGDPVTVEATRAARASPEHPPNARFSKIDLEQRAAEQFERVRTRIEAMSPEERQTLHREQLARAEGAEPGLLVQLEDPDPLARVDAVEDLPIEGEGDIGEIRVQRIVAVAEGDPDRDVRIAALDRLGEVHHPDALRVLVEALDNPDSGLVLAAIDALEFVDDPSVIPDLEPLLDDPQSEVREAARAAIEWLGD